MSYGANAESTRLTHLEDCVQAAFLLANPQPTAPCPFKLDPVPNLAVTTKLESTRLMEKVVACPLYYRNEIGGVCMDLSSGSSVGSGSGSGSGSRPGSGFGSSPVYGQLVSARSFASIKGIDQITVVARGTTSGELIGRTRVSVINSSANRNVASTNPMMPVFFRTNGPGTSSSGAPLPICRPAKTAQDSGVPFAPIVRCDGPRVVG